MNYEAKDFLDYIVNEAPKSNKEAVIDSCVKKFGLVVNRSLYCGNGYAVRFSYSKDGSFGNTILSLSTLLKHDAFPFFVVLVVKNNNNKVFLANTTFLKKISHSSQTLSVDNIRGSFNGSDIMMTYNNIENSVDNFDKLFAIHQGFDVEDNIERLIEASSKIVSISKKFIPSAKELNYIYDSINTAIKFVDSNAFKQLEKELQARVELYKKEILKVSKIVNTNIRGRLIESLITSDLKTANVIKNNIDLDLYSLPTYESKNGLGDFVKDYDEYKTFTDIKTKILFLHSNPKGFNIDKFLETVSQPNVVFLFFFLGIDEDQIKNTRLCSVYHSELLENVELQMHWAGRATRGVVQYLGPSINSILDNEHFNNKIDYNLSKKFLDTLLER